MYPHVNIDGIEASTDEYPPVPEGKVRLSESGDVPTSPRTVLRVVARNGKPDYYMTRVGRGFVLAGSCLRFTEAHFLVGFVDPVHGTSHGRSFRGYNDAVAYLAKVTEQDTDA